MARNRHLGAALMTGITVFVCVSFVHAQTQGGRGGQGGSQNMMTVGELVQIDSRSLTVKTQNGENKQYQRTEQTAFIKETSAATSDLVQGTIVFVVGQSAGQNAVAPRMIRITDRLEDVQGQRGSGMQGGSMMRQGGQGMQGGSMMQQGGQRMGGNIAQDQTASGPVVGTIIGTNPLTMQKTTGESVRIEPTGDTRIIRETSVPAEDFVVGAHVRVIAPPKPGSDAREAKKVILISAGQQSQRGSMVTVASSSDASRTIGYVGCSLTLAAVDGYESLGGDKFWPDTEAARSYPGGSVAAWYADLVNPSREGSRWRTFDELLGKYRATRSILWHLCPNDNNAEIPTYAQVVQVFSEIKKKTSAGIFVTADSVNDRSCPAEDGRCPKRLREFADRMVRDGLVEKGPLLTPLRTEQVGPDGHPNKEGQKIWGSVLLGFFL